MGSDGYFNWFPFDRLLTVNGFFNGSTLNFNYAVIGDVGYLATKDLYLYGGVELNGITASLPYYSSAYIGVNWYLM